MKVVLDLQKLLLNGDITLGERDRLLRLGRRETGLLLVNLLTGFGVIAVSGGMLAIMPNVVAGVVLGAILMVVGAGLLWLQQSRWGLLANICVLLAALFLGAGIILLSQNILGPNLNPPDTQPILTLPLAFLAVAGLFAASAVLARSALLASACMLMVFAALGGRTAYAAAAYGLGVPEPLATVLVFGAIAEGAYLLSRRARPDWERLILAAARTAVMLVNFGFWIGSLWGDDLDWLHLPNGAHIPPGAFALAWAVAILIVGGWAAWANRRWVLNVAAVFGAIHFYTQWFERLGASPVSVLAGGVILLAFAVVLWWVNRATEMPARESA